MSPRQLGQESRDGGFSGGGRAATLALPTWRLREGVNVKREMSGEKASKTPLQRPFLSSPEDEDRQTVWMSQKGERTACVEADLDLESDVRRPGHRAGEASHTTAQLPAGLWKGKLALAPDASTSLGVRAARYGRAKGTALGSQARSPRAGSSRSWCWREEEAGAAWCLGAHGLDLARRALEAVSQRGLPDGGMMLSPGSGHPPGLKQALQGTGKELESCPLRKGKRAAGSPCNQDLKAGTHH